jgi:hypothetical protein
MQHYIEKDMARCHTCSRPMLKLTLTEVGLLLCDDCIDYHWGNKYGREEEPRKTTVEIARVRYDGSDGGSD